MSTPSTSKAVVAGVDGSETAAAAARWAGALAARLDAPLELVHSLPSEGIFYSEAAVLIQSQMIDQLEKDGKQVLSDVADLVRADNPGLEVQSFIGPGPAATSLLEAAEDARVLVMGATGAGKVENFLLGSTVVRVSNHAPCPVVVWRGDTTDPLPSTKPIVVGVDGSELSAAAVEYAFEYAQTLGAPLSAVHSWIGDAALGVGATAALVDWKAVEESESAVLAESLAGLHEKYPDVEVSRVIDRGPAAKVLLNHLQDAQLAVVGSHGRGQFAAALLGSTSQNLLHNAPCPVLVARRP
ncbi:universal stress protein [Rhodococcus artemisiae]|uniref:Universal stress protein n=1 Tax=Rhodococcus artemisiae TaxID=714159 RepID=A0ABU7LGC6_9NOCA|nr:universal stress protein [Rhodococcus artemisiae]MEE2060593.1 universal stress protein [Rhodococcus artemisiae]